MIWLFRALLTTLGLLCATFVYAADQTRSISFGVGFGGQHLNDYRGSKELQTNALPFPFIIYRGKYLKIDEENGVRTEFWRNRYLELNLSADVALRSGDDENALREGMPPLDAAFALGPTVNFLLLGEGFDDGLALRFPLRSVITVNLGRREAGFIGYTFSPELTYKKLNLLPRLNFKATVGPIYGSRRYHDYYYSIDEKYINDVRLVYQADAGYSGLYSELGLFSQYKQWLFKFSLRYDNLSHATFKGSDLVETEHYFSGSFGFGWLI